MNYEDLLVEKKDGIVTITLNSPDKLNAISRKMRESLLLAIDEVNKDDDVKVVIVTGAGRGFCSGADLTELRGVARKEPSLYERLKGITRPAFFRLEKPVIAAINGVCVGAGFSLALSCDIRIASAEARFGSAFIKLGATPDNGMTYWLPRIMGTAEALEFMLTGQIISAVEAKQLGIVSRVIPPDELLKVSQELASRIAQYPAIALALTKRLVYRSMIDDVAHHYDWEAWAGQMCRQTEDNKEAMSAFIEKRPTQFKGR